VSEVLAVYGGSFDPPHVAHTLVATYVLSAYEVDSLIVVPTGRHPFDKSLTPFEHRLRMLEIAMRNLAHVEISTIEGQLEGPSVTLRTLELLKQAHPASDLRLIIGSDLLAETPNWHRFDRVAELAPPIVVARAGHETPGEGGPALPEVSSTEVRARLREGRSTEGLLDPRVADYAKRHGLYV